MTRPLWIQSARDWARNTEPGVSISLDDVFRQRAQERQERGLFSGGQMKWPDVWMALRYRYWIPADRSGFNP